MKTEYAKPRVMELADPIEIASALRCGTPDEDLEDIIGARHTDGKVYAYIFSVERFRKRRLRLGEPG